MEQAVYQTDIRDVPLLKRGKVRDIYDLGENLLLVATDRISAFDVVMPEPVPEKGKVLTRISLFWFALMEPVIGNHLVTSDVEQYPRELAPHKDMLRGRSMLVKKTRPLPVECVVRGYLSGSGWKSYQQSGDVCGIALPPGLKESDPLPEPIFTPSTKAEAGEHDVNISFEQAAELVGWETAEKIQDISLSIYRSGARTAEERGIIIADTKFEFGFDGDSLLLIDELLTPDSSRFWPRATYEPGGAQQSFDKQYLRDYLLSLDWDKTPPAPSLPREVIANTRQKYLEALRFLVGRDHEL
ncbi:MAG TPA: phosphoribosylaminoimidazolesuccinocarboxamide synthase [Desulfosalsimonadaceae bacterium]|nr:phosphoribosylaminoimidazolesuccinocarboxamide synthase [Desulfosalsimonadaceae bacterium]